MSVSIRDLVGRLGEEETLQVPVPEPVEGELAATHGGEQGAIVRVEWTCPYGKRA